MCKNINDNTIYRDYMNDFIGYTYQNNNNYKIEIVLNYDIKNTISLKLDSYYNECMNHYYYENKSDLILNQKKGHMVFFIKNNEKIINNVSFNYTLNNPNYNNDIFKLINNNNILYLYLTRKKIDDLYYINKIIYTTN
tara:strand:- start:112 stop:525 length:414 start_codon:yes stop_codon:yes gene_type:complete